MKFIKKLLILILLLFLVGCTNTTPSDTVTLPNLNGLSREEIAKKLDAKGIRYQFLFKEMSYYNSDYFDQFVEYGQDLKYGDKVNKNDLVTVYTTALELPSDLPNVSLDFEYIGKTLEEDGVELVTLARAVDGDTAHFYTQSGEYIKVRFLGVDTPESTYQKEAWGKAAANFMKDLLENAETIVVQFDPTGNHMDTYDRYLAYVWADGVLTNLELVKNGYSTMKLSSKSPYFDAFYETEILVSQTGRRVWGEIDPNYDYENQRFK